VCGACRRAWLGTSAALAVCDAIACAVDNRGARVLEVDDSTADEGGGGADAASPTEGWVPFEAVKTIGLESMRGRTSNLVGDSRPDGNGTLSVWLDSLRLQARCE
jgi:hypothetical protein